MKLSLVTFCLIWAGCSYNPDTSPTKSLTSDNEHPGRWLATISVGGGVSADGTLTLRNFLADTFTKPRGGSYEHIIDIDDIHPDSKRPTRQELRDSIQQLANRVSNFRASHPQEKTMVMLGLTGHGSPGMDRDRYTFQLADGKIDGDELVALIGSIGADETVLVMQSCFSGALVERYFPGFSPSLAGFAQNVAELASARGLRLSVITPVSSHIESPAYNWEEDILRPATNDRTFDKNQDNILSYGEWKNAITYHGCAHFEFAPRSAYASGGQNPYPHSGLDPQFYESNFYKDIPMVAFDENFQVPNTPWGGSPDLWASTASFCRKQTDLFQFLWHLGNNLAPAFQRYAAEGDLEKAKILSFLAKQKHSSELTQFIKAQITSVATPATVKAEAIYAYAKTTAEEQDLDWGPLLPLVENFSQQDLHIKRALVFAASRSPHSSLEPIIPEIFAQETDPQLLKFSLMAGSYVSPDTTARHALRIYNTASSDTLRSHAIEALWSIDPESHKDTLRQAITNDISPQVKISAIQGCMLFPSDCHDELGSVLRTPIAAVQANALMAIKQGELKSLAPQLIAMLDVKLGDMALVMLLDLLETWEITDALPKLREAAALGYAPIFRTLILQTIRKLDAAE